MNAFCPTALCLSSLALATAASAAVVEDFEDGVADGFVVVDGNGSRSDSDANFVVVTEGSNNVYTQTNSNLLNSDATGGDFAGKAGGYALVGESFTGGVDASLDLRANDANGFGDAALLFGYQDNDNYYLIVFNETGGNNQVFSVIGNARNAVGGSFDGNGPAAGTGITAGSFYDVELDYDALAGSVAITVDGLEVYNQTNPVFSVLGADGGFGIGSINDSASFDNLDIVAVPEPTAAAVLGLLGLAGLRRRR